MEHFRYSVLSSVYYNENPLFLRRSIESIVNQTICTDDYIIVKDGKLPPDIQKVLDEYSEKYPFIHIYGYEINKGLGYALNFGLNKCKNELVARMDTDDISLPTRCERELKEFESDPELHIVGTSIMEFEDDENTIVSVKNMPVDSIEIKRYAHRRNPFNHPTVMYKKSKVLEMGGYLEGVRGEDVALFTKMVFEGCKTKNINDSLFMYRANNNQYKRRSSLVDAKAVISVFRNNYKAGYIGLNDYLFVLSAQCAGIIIPDSIGEKIFKRFFRQ